MKSPALELENVTFKYNQRSVLEKISFKVYYGEYVGLIGANGSGKTTLLKLILGLLPLQSGKIKIFQKPLADFKSWSKIGYVPQYINDLDRYFPIDVGELISSNLKTKKNLKQSLNEILEFTNLTSLKNRLFWELSGGEKQRVLIARSLVNKPQLLILDEPTSGVDPNGQKDFYKFLKTINQQQKITILFVSHDLGAISNEAGRILCVDSKNLTDMKNHTDPEILKQSLSRKIQHVHH